MQNRENKALNRWVVYVVGGTLTIVAATKPNDFSILMLYAFFLFALGEKEKRAMAERTSSHRTRARAWWLDLAERCSALWVMSGIFLYLERIGSLQKVSQEIDAMFWLCITYFFVTIICWLIVIWVNGKKNRRHP